MSTELLEPSRVIVVYRGRPVVQRDYGPEDVTVRDDGDAFPDALLRGDDGDDGGPWVRIPYGQVTRKVARTTTATFAGRDVEVVAVTATHAGILYSGGADWAELHGLQGSQHEGWGGEVPRSALSAIRVTERELRVPAR